VYIFEVKKRINGKWHKIRIWDTFNYVPSSLEKIGASIGYPKMKTPDFADCEDRELSIYCKNDVDVIHHFIEKLIEFLKKHNLTRLKSTGSAIAFNAFRHRFYDMENNPIHIHANPKAIKLERDSYKGGITECYQIGQYKKHSYKVDINSMYPAMMKNKMPVKLLYYNEGKTGLKEEMIQAMKEGYHVIADCTIWLPEEYSFILSKLPTKDKKCGFIQGIQQVSLTTPEIDFVLKHGKIDWVSRLSVYKTAKIFDEYVDFFYAKKSEYKKDNPVFCEFSKLCLNKLYGKFGQRGSDYKLLYKNMPCDVKSYEQREAGKPAIHFMHFGNKVYQVKRNDENSMDSFVAISSIITGYARVYLSELILKADKKHVFYNDTDSLILDEEGLLNLKEYLNDDEIGKFKIEKVAERFEIIKPKHYVFGDEIKCKGVKKSSIILHEDDKEMTVLQQQFERFNSSFRNNSIDYERVKWTVKVISKTYDKGRIDEDGKVHPFFYDDFITSKSSGETPNNEIKVEIPGTTE
jgi:hypothetical protein